MLLNVRVQSSKPSLPVMDEGQSLVQLPCSFQLFGGEKGVEVGGGRGDERGNGGWGSAMTEG